MNRLYTAGDTGCSLDIQDGGIAFVPNHTGFAFCGSSIDSITRICSTKRPVGYKCDALTVTWKPAAIFAPAVLASAEKTKEELPDFYSNKAEAKRHIPDDRVFVDSVHLRPSVRALKTRMREKPRIFDSCTR